jgi:hypothetical protein
MALVLGVLVVIGFVVCAIAAVPIARRRLNSSADTDTFDERLLAPEPGTIRILDSSDEVRAALEEAMAFEQGLAREANRRVARYRKALGQLEPASASTSLPTTLAKARLREAS